MGCTVYIDRSPPVRIDEIVMHWQLPAGYCRVHQGISRVRIIPIRWVEGFLNSRFRQLYVEGIWHRLTDRRKYFYYP